MLRGEFGKTCLVRIDHQYIALVIANDTPRNSQPPSIRLNGRPNLKLKMLVSLTQRLLKQPLHLLLSVTQPARTSCISRHSSTIQRVLQSLRLAPLLLLQQLDRLFRCNRIRDIAEINALHKLLWSHIRHYSPYRLVEGLGPEIPDGVHDGTESEVNDAFLRSDPA